MFTSSRSVMAVLVLAAAVHLSACSDQESATDTEDTTSVAEDPATETQDPAADTQDPATDTQDAAANGSSPNEQEADRANFADAVAELEATEGNEASGTLSFTALDRGVRIKADIEGLSPGQHGFHIHAQGDCSAPDASSAGGHFNPTDAEHGAPDDETHHAGDLGNIEADATGRVMLDREFPFLTLSGENGILGKAVVVHAGQDDLESQPAGDSGPRVACGVIREDSQVHPDRE